MPGLVWKKENKKKWEKKDGIKMTVLEIEEKVQLKKIDMTKGNFEDYDRINKRKKRDEKTIKR